MTKANRGRRRPRPQRENRTSPGSFNKMPGRGRNRAIEAKAEAAFRSLIADSPDFIVQRADENDFGSDCQIEVLDEGLATNVRLHVQLKGTERSLNADGALSISIEQTNLNYLIAQGHSLFVACHVPTGSLRLTTAEAVLRQYEHKNLNWKDQGTLTVTFTEELTLDRLTRLAELALSSSRSARDERIAQVQAIPSAFPDVVRDAMPAINVPDDPERALQILEALYERGADLVISAAFDQFAAVLGSDSAEMGCCYMSEINLGMAGRGHPDRIGAGKAHFKAKLRTKRYLPGSLHYTIGNAYSALGDEKSAKASYQAATRDAVYMADPGMAATCLKNLGSSFEKLGNEEMAAELYRGALEMNQELPEAHLALGQYLHRQGQFEEALTHYDATLFGDRDLGKNASVTGWRLNALFNLGQDREAFRAINLLLADADREPWIWSWCAQQVAAFSRTSVATARGALAFWQRYVRTHPNVSAARADLLLTSFYLRSEGEEIGKDYAAFRAEFETHIAHVDPSDAALPWDRLGHWAQDLDDWEEAEHCFRKAYELDGGHYGYCLGTALNFLGRHGEALPLVQAQADSIQPDAMSWFQVASALDHLGRTDEAVAAYRKALILDPDYAVAMFNMAGVLWNRGDREEGGRIFRTAVAQFPNHELSAKARQDLPNLF
ncbi:tetratricopeptide repeat protein [Sphingomonadaceae bacterium jetA1]|uniref:tetratricopeptide repeat protein n=1 Tax=Facivitalis istanbulensis TaxID=3075838 RepID=UPI0034736549